MAQPQSIEFPLAKTEYLLTRKAKSGESGDKQNFWQRILDLTTTSGIRATILASISIDILSAKGSSVYGDRVKASMQITGLNGNTYQV